ncbi:MAG: hypothetical protein IJS93_01550 [Clostridia bacterium]|nr:hypothetical protein [Clostridia bacterium]
MDALTFLLDETKYCQEKYDELDRLLLAPEITADVLEVKKLSQKKAYYENVIKLRKEVLRLSETINAYQKDLEREGDGEYRKLLKEEIDSLKRSSDEACLKLTSSLEENTLMKLTVVPTEDERKHALLNAYVALAKKLGYKIEKVEDGYLVFGGARTLSTANAVHKITGDKSGKIQVAVFPYVKAEEEIDKKDVRVDIFLSHGKGGQNINKVETAVRLTYLPRNIVVTCQDERSQLENKKRAYEKLSEAVKRAALEEAEKINSKEYEIAVKKGEKVVRVLDFARGVFSDVRGGSTSLEDFLKGDISALTTAIIINEDVSR